VISAQEALATFFQSTTSFLALIDGTTDDRWPLRSAGEEWSPAETVEHVVLTNRATLRRLQHVADAVPMANVARFPDSQIVEQMFHGVPAPTGLAEPTGRFATRAEGVSALIAVRDGVADSARVEDGRLRDIGFVHPVFGTFDGVQWILFLAAHTDNHIPQLRRLRDAPPSSVARPL
jgi:hypothetical protein